MRRRQTIRAVIVAATVVFGAAPALAWGPDGHHTVGAIADRLIAGRPAQAQVQALLGGLSLQDAAVWADCAKGIDPSKDFKYTSAGKYPECRIFETPEGEAGMADFVRRNNDHCARAADDHTPCHSEYHYTDEPIQRRSYQAGSPGTRDADIVAALGAVLRVLAGDPAPRPFDIKDKREALLLLAHYVGDIHQPLHVGAIYLDAHGARVDPAATGADPATDTAGGNAIATLNKATNQRGSNLHSTWDAIPESFQARHIGPTWLAQARKVPITPGPPAAWPAAWATETLGGARTAFAGLTFSAKDGDDWTTSLACRYFDTTVAIKKRQLTLAGARLAQVLTTLWP